MKSNTITLLNKYSKEEIYKYYIEENHTQKECWVHFNITSFSWNKLLKIYNISKPQSLIQANIKKHNLEVYGVEYVSQDNTIKSKMKASRANKTIEELEAIKNKFKQTNLERYGVTTYSQLEESKEKVKATNINKYGVDHIAKSPIYLKKKKKTCLKRYGVENYTNKEKANITIKEKYGVDNFGEMCKLESIKNKKKSRVNEKYGVDYYTQSLFNNYDPLYEILYHNKDKSIIYLIKHPNLTFKELAEIFKCPLNSIFNWIHRFNLNSYVKNEQSHYEQEIINLLKEIEPKINLITNSRKILENGQELDIYLPEYKLAIEFNGKYWHSSLHKDSKYHLKKSKLAQEKGIRLIHIWEYEWDNIKQREKIIYLIKTALGKIENRIYARKCIIKQISNKEAKILNNKVHLQNHRGAQITYGLFYNNELVQLMSFNKHPKYEWEIIRGCPGSNVVVIGGVSKLFKHFIKEHNPNKIFSYCDFNKFNGISYEKLGMKFIGYTGPDMKWLLKNFEVVNRNPNKHKELKSNSIAQLYGAGSKKYLWEKSICEKNV